MTKKLLLRVLVAIAFHSQPAGPHVAQIAVYAFTTLGAPCNQQSSQRRIWCCRFSLPGKEDKE
jgi:hypothetical protein